MDREELRPAKFTAFYNGEEVIYITIAKDGYFHRWADDAFADNTDKYFQRVVGIVEATDGEIYKVPPEALTLFPKKSLYERAMEQFENVTRSK
jgi:hypothetical protein